jgi:hypothetical protein
MEKNNMELKDKFWKYASASNAVDNIENIFIKWAGEEKLSIDEFNSTYAEVNNQINDYFGKTANIRIDADGSVSGPAEEVQQYIEKLQQQEQEKNNIPQESNFNDENATADAPIDSSDLATPDPTEDIAQQPIESESNVGQDMNKTSISPEPNSEINETMPEENKEEESQFPLLDIIGS